MNRDTEGVKRKNNPKEKANIFSLLSFFYIKKLFKESFKKDFDENSLYQVLKKLTSNKLGNELEKHWEDAKERKEHISLAKLLVSCYAKRYLYLGLIQLVMKTFFVVSTPMVLGKLIFFATDEKVSSRNEAYFYGAMVWGIHLFRYIYELNYNLAKTELRIEIQTAICSLIYRKSLKLSPTALSQITIGKIITLISKDIVTFEYTLDCINDFWVDFIEILVIVYLFYLKVGVAGFIGFAMFFVTIPIQLYVAKMVYIRRSSSNKKSDERLQLTQEILSSIRIIKMYTWEKFFKDQVTESRRNEMKNLREMLMLKHVAYFCGKISSNLSFFMLISSYVWFNNTLTAEIVYYILNCYDNLENTLTYLIPLCIHHSGELLASLKRYDMVLNSEEIIENDLILAATILPKINIKNVDVQVHGKELLRDINLNIGQGLTVIAGPVGCGKSTLLKAILREFVLDKGQINLEGDVSYSSQNPWLFPSSIRQNILFGQVYNEEKYKTILKICALEFDFEKLARGDRTIVGDCGINLSKGQQARVNLARSVYREADIYLLDDCLSSLDAHVRNHIFKHCIKGYLKDKLCVLVTHNVRFIKKADNVVLMDNGNVVYTGSAQDVPEILYQVTSEQLEHSKTKINDDQKSLDEESKTLPNGVNATETNNIYHENNKYGKVPWSVYRKYIVFGGGFVFFSFILALTIIADGSNTYSKKIVSEWVNVDEHISTFKNENKTNTTEYSDLLIDSSYHFNLYNTIVMISTALYMVMFVLHFIFTTRISVTLHNQMISSVLGATMHFFDVNLIGNILNRFSKDLYYIDEDLVYSLNEFILIILMVIGASTLIASVNLMFLILSIIFIIMYSVLCYLVLPFGLTLRRLNSSTRSPVVGHLNASLEGLTTVRACRTQTILKEEFDKHQDLFTSAHHSMNLFLYAFQFIMKMLSLVFVGIVICYFLFIQTDLAGNVGLALSQAFSLTVFLEYCITQWVQMESEMTCFERALEYIDVKQENGTGENLDNWPSEGRIRFENVSLTYRSKDEQVLKNINMDIKPSEKVSIVGRTGAGKSSVIVALFRLYETEGDIYVDGVNTKTLSLKCLRNGITIIPQDPILFTGTIRANLDPFHKYTDEQLWKVLKSVNLKPLIPSLDSIVSDCDTNFSIGEKQLICLARAILGNTKIIVLDEATANMDEKMDQFIHSRITECFSSCTVISISHRLKSVLDGDKVIVLEDGELVECGNPRELVKDSTTEFYKMALKAGLVKK